jgi:hypothetical protein
MFVLPQAGDSALTIAKKERPIGRALGERGVAGLDHLNRRFPGQARIIRSRMREDPSFREMCQDFEAASAALAYWQSSPRRSKDRAEDYRRLLAELDVAIEAALRD